jgi:hypothetical protein
VPLSIFGFLSSELTAASAPEATEELSGFPLTRDACGAQVGSGAPVAGHSPRRQDISRRSPASATSHSSTTLQRLSMLAVFQPTRRWMIGVRVELSLLPLSLVARMSGRSCRQRCVSTLSWMSVIFAYGGGGAGMVIGPLWNVLTDPASLDRCSW